MEKTYFEHGLGVVEMKCLIVKNVIWILCTHGDDKPVWANVWSLVSGPNSLTPVINCLMMWNMFQTFYAYDQRI